MNHKRKMDLIYTVIGVMLMCPTMVIFNKYMALKDIMEYPLTNPAFWSSVLTGFLQRVIPVFLLQYFSIQKFAERKTAEHTRDDDDVYLKMAVRTGFTVVLMCPILSIYSQILLILEGRITSFEMFINNWIPGMVMSGMFAFIIHTIVIGPLNRKIFLAIVKRMKKHA